MAGSAVSALVAGRARKGRRRGSALFGGSALVIAMTLATGASPGAACAAAADAGASQVSEVTVTAKRDDLYNVLPDRKTGSVFDLPLTIEDTPRSITLIESPLISLYGIRSVDDFVNITPGT